MRTRVTAILVARHGGEWLDETLAGIAAQTRQPDRVIAVVNGGRESLAHELRTAPGIDGVVSTQAIVPFGSAVQQAVASLPSAQAAASAGQPGAPAEPVEDWFWLLTEDSAPEGTALAEILSTVQKAPSVAVAGPKLVAWDHPDRIIELGQSLTQRGDRWLLRRQERDQQQYDHLQDVLGVGPVGMLVRADVWRQLEGFDPAYPVYDDALDLSVRARLAGFRVVVSPTSRIRFAQRGVAGPRIERSKRVLRTAHREARTAQLHRKIAYASAFAAFFMWLGLPLVALGRVCWALIRERPGNIWAEFSSALRVFFTPASLLASRRRVRNSTSVGWGAVRPLRVDTKSVRTARMIDREAILVSQGRMRDELHFISGGGLAVLVTSVLISIALTWWAITHTSLAGGALAPLSPLGELWQSTRSVNGVPADPFAWVLAILGTLTFWNPSHAVVLMLVTAIPLAALGGWVWAAQLTKNSAGRALLALAWALSPVLLGSLAAGRLPTLILAVVLPWLLVAATRARDSWSWAGTASLLAAIALACAPVLIPAAIVLLIVGVISSPKGAARVLSVAIVPLALFAPKLLSLLRGDHFFDLFVDPGVLTPFTPASSWQLMIGFPEFGLEGWGKVLGNFGISGLPVTALVGLLFVPIVLLAALGLVTGRVLFTVLHAILGGVGLLTAVAASHLYLTSVGSQEVAVWTGSGLALYWIALLGLASVGTATLRKVAAPIVAVGAVLALVAVAPLAVKLATNSTDMVPGTAQMPALLQAAGAQNPNLRTLVMNVEGSDAVRARIVEGAGVRLDQLRTSAAQGQLTPADSAISDLVSALASTGNEEHAKELLESQSIGFVLLEGSGDSTERSQLQSSFDQQSSLEPAGQTSHGLLWRSTGVDIAKTPATVANDAAQSWIAGVSEKVLSTALWWVQLVVLVGMFLLALPTGEVVERPEKRKKRKKVDKQSDDAVAPLPPVAPVLAGPENSVEPVEPTEPVQSAEPAEPVQPAEPAHSAEPATAEPGPVTQAGDDLTPKIPKFLQPSEDLDQEGGAR